MLAPITRPDGRVYRPRKLSVSSVCNSDEEVEAVVVFGTHDHQAVQALAEREARSLVDSGTTAVFDQIVWWRDGFSGGRRAYVTDEVRGRAGCLFDIVEAS